MKDAEQIANAVAYAMEKCCECPLTEICNENCENMWKRFLTSGRVRGKSIPKENHCKNNPEMVQKHSGRCVGKFSCTASIDTNPHCACDKSHLHRWV